MAGNIIPAIATTNAMVAGLAVLTLIKIINKSYDQSGNCYLSYNVDSKHLISNEKIQPPNPACSACSSKRAILTCKNASEFTLKDLLDLLRSKKGGLYYEHDFTISEGTRLLWDADFDDNESRSLNDLCLKNKFINIIDEDLGHLAMSLFVLENAKIKSTHKIEVTKGETVKREHVMKRKRDLEEEEEAKRQKQEETDETIVLEDDDLIIQ
jgi:ubiquitin-like 1-activating enzyme E1 B